MRHFLWVLLFSLISILLFGKISSTSSIDVQTAYYPGNQESYGINTGGFAPISYSLLSNEVGHDTNKDPGRTVGTTWGGVEAQVIYHQKWKIPVLIGEGSLFKGNNLTFGTYGKLSPVHLDIGFSATLTPIALLKFFVGGAVETGWNFFGLFNGLGRNLPGITNTAPLSEPLSGIIIKNWFGGTLMFDLGAVIPGDWTHIVMVASPKIQYEALLAPKVTKDTAWQKEADKGLNFNGWKYYGTYFVGYQFPAVPVLDMLGLLIESEQYIDSYNVKRSPISNGWGSDFTLWRFAPMVNLKLAPKDSLTFLFQFSHEIHYTDKTLGNRYFEYRLADGTYTFFRRIAIAYSHKL